MVMYTFSPKAKPPVALFLTLVFLAGSAASCPAGKIGHSFDINSVKSYRDIPGVTDEEIQAVEAIKSARESFSYRTLLSSEAFRLPDGTKSGFAAMFCDLLSGLFGIPFIWDSMDWNSLSSGLENHSVDFTGDLTPTPDRRRNFFMTYPVAERALCAYTIAGTVKVATESDLNGLRIGFLADSITALSIQYVYSSFVFEEVNFTSISEAVEDLEAGNIDAFIIDSMDVFFFQNYTNIESVKVFPLVYTPVSLTTANPALRPVISVVDKYLAAGGIDRFHDLYREGSYEYAKYKFIRTLSIRERDYLDRLAADGGNVPVALENDNYPVCFYDKQYNAYHGIAVDILAGIARLTGITFDVVTDGSMKWSTTLEKLKTGEASLLSELQFSEERRGRFLWADYPYMSTRYVLLSKSSYPNLEMYQVVRARVGVVRETVYEYFYNVWFPENNNAILYPSSTEAIAALEKGDIDLFMTTENTLLTIINYNEKSGYKSNIAINARSAESYFGFNINEDILRSIISKAQNFIEKDLIVKDWTSRIYDYSRTIAYQRLLYVTVSAVILSIMMAVLIFMLVKNNRMSKKFVNQAATLSTIYKFLPDAVFCKNLNGVYISCNSQFEKLYGIKESDVIGKTDLELFPGDEESARRFIEEDRKVLEKGVSLTVEKLIPFVDPAHNYRQTVLTPLIMDGKMTGLLGISRDITDLHAAVESAQDASRAKSDFLAKMSHEIRTPMNAIVGMTELALRAEELNTAHEHILTVKQASANLLSIINDILDFSKIETGKFEVNPGDYLFSSLVNDVINIIRMKVLDSQVRFVVNIDSSIPNALYGDEIRIRQVLLNILGNAVKYTEKGFVSFTVHGDMTGDDSINLVMEVMDSGKGIKEEDLHRLFGEYVQFDLKSNRGTEGTGLGLAITKSIVKAMGGDIGVYSEYGKGSSFTVTLPQKVRSPEVLAVVDRPEDKGVLVYERREIYANSVFFAIDNLGVECTVVSNDEEFIQKLKENVYAFIFISFSLYNRNRDTVSGLGANSKVVILAEFGETIPDKNLNVIAMPIHSISVADILNGQSGKFSYNENNELIVRFTAPDANILVVDDVITNLNVVKGLLMPYKIQVALCKSGKMALKAITNNRYDLVFMDHRMPEMDGVETTRHIRAMGAEDPYYNDVPVIALTADAVSGIKEMFFTNGFNDFLSKPIDTVRLDAVLERWIPKEKQHGSVNIQ
ncbi:MAG: transporter substrate-binding domain-containing protein [Treponema sp.]|nr:transporter substrate-binding domain-containing protein [Treponema sp.]